MVEWMLWWNMNEFEDRVVNDKAANATYPTRPRFFANRVIRLMCKTCLANELGADTVLLLTIIVSQEDAKRYLGPVTFYNNQLQPRPTPRGVPVQIGADQLRSQSPESAPPALIGQFYEQK